MNLLRDADAPLPSGGGDEKSARRAGSVTLRSGESGGEERASMMDPANQSLADALRVMLVLLQAGMAILAFAYLASGFGSVKEGNKGIRLLFGRIEASNVEPGFAWTAPYPLGELVQIKQGNEQMSVERDFWPDYTGDPAADKLTPEPALKPGKGGSVITGDGNIAHTRWTVTYHRAVVDSYAQNVIPGAANDGASQGADELKLVLAAVKRGIVHACAGVSIEELLKPTSDQPGAIASSVSAQAMKIAQETLDKVGSGIVIDQLAPRETIPPVYIRRDFAAVQAAVSKAGKAVEDAQGEGARLLFETAGRAAPYLVERLEAYEAAAGEHAAAEAGGNAAALKSASDKMDQLLTQIDALLQGQPVELAPGTVKVAGTPTPLEGGVVQGLIGGGVAATIAEAAAYRTATANRAQSELRRFQAKLEQYKANPKVMLQREWGEAVAAFLSRDSVQQWIVPDGVGTLSFLMNADQDVAREMYKAQKERERRKAEEDRMKELQRERFKTETGLNEVPG